MIQRQNPVTTAPFSPHSILASPARFKDAGLENPPRLRWYIYFVTQFDTIFGILEATAIRYVVVGG